MTGKANTYKEYGILGLFSLLACGMYLIFSVRTAGLGFPLDDAWIHQAFARNFAQTFTWSFQRGLPSGGSTGPLWGFLLTFIHLAGIPEVFGTHLVGFLLLWGCSISAYEIIRLTFPASRLMPLFIGAIISLEWHLVWSALSGMETVLLILISLQVFRWMLQKRVDWWVPGVLTGLSLWIRPDGLTLMGPLLLSLVCRKGTGINKIRAAAMYLGCLVLVSVPYFVFNHNVAGDLWPNTFYAKQAEYAILRQTGLLVRFFNLSKQILTGIGVMLLPGFVLEAYAIGKERNWEKAGILIWSVGYVIVYAVRLPVIYQHGRYIMPAIPAFILIGSMGIARWLEFRSKVKWKRFVSLTWGGSSAAILGIFLILGARAYALDVGVIESEMVQVARWVNENTPSTAVIGAHDIGALGYFGERQIIDLAGLITPDVIPFIRDQELLADYLTKNKADYLITFPSWYPELIQELPLLYRGSGEYTDQFEMDRMSVFIWK